MQNKLTEPCKQCPWRRKAMPGWLAQFQPGWFVWHATHEGVACHMTVKHDGDPNASYCVGALIACRNAHIVPKDGKAVDAVLTVQKDTVNVFATMEEFTAHHEGAKIKSWELR